jgi:hypothetical protein
VINLRSPCLLPCFFDFRSIIVIPSLQTKFEAVTVQQWQNICSHVEKIEVEYMKREYIVDEVEDLIISINGEESDESDFFLSSDEEQVDEKEVQGGSSSSNLADLGCELLT